MLTSDLCLAFRSNKEYVDCTKSYLKDKATKEPKRLECTANDMNRATDLDPNVEPECCISTNFWHLRAMGIPEFYDEDFTYCGEDYTQANLKTVKPSFSTCCIGKKRTCDHYEFP